MSHYAIFECQTLEEIQAKIRQLEKRAAAGDGEAALVLSDVYSPHNVFSEDIKKSIPTCQEISDDYQNLSEDLTRRELVAGSVSAMRRMAIFYQTGTAKAEADVGKCIYWNEQALAKGCFFAANDLLAFYADPLSKWHNPSKADEMRSILREHECGVVDV